MGIGEAREFLDKSVLLRWLDRKGIEVEEPLHISGVGFVPFYGPCLITSRGEIRLDRVLSCALVSTKAA
jgi:hypothetical protein